MIDAQFFGSVVTTAAPIALAALGALLCFRAGFFNIAIEGQMLVGAFAGALAATLTGSTIVAVLAACLASVTLGAVVALLTFAARVDAIVAGIAANILAAGLTALLTREITGGNSSILVTEGRLPRVPSGVVDSWPVAGDLLRGQTPLVALAVLAIGVVAWALARTRTGLAIRALGESVESVQGSGLRVGWVRTAMTAGCGILCGLAGAQLALGPATSFSVGMTNGRGFTAMIAAMIGASVGAAVLGSLLFGSVEAIGLRIQLSGSGLPPEVVQMIPYLLTLVVLAIASRVALRTVDPAQRRILRH